MTEDQKIQIARINELTLVGRTNWIGLLAYLVFVTITILGVEDADFFLPGRGTEIPLVGVTIPTQAFFYFAPLLATALYIWLHLHIRKIGTAIAAPPAQIDTQKLETHLKSWILTDMALMWRASGYTNRPLDWLVAVAAIGLIWLYGPFVIGLAWVWSWPAHQEWLSSALCAAMFACIAVGAVSLVQLRAAIAGPWPLRSAWGLLGSVLVSMLIVACFFLSWLKTEIGAIRGSGAPAWSMLATADLSRLAITTLPPDRRDPDRARQSHRQSWCAAQGLAPTICGRAYDGWQPVDPVLAEARNGYCAARISIAPGGCADHFAALEDAFHADWQDFRAAEITALATVDWSGADLRNADFSGSQINGANLAEARLQGADFFTAELQGANFYRAQAQDAYFALAQLHRAEFFWAELQGADMRDTGLSAARLWRAEMAGALLARAELQGATLAGAQLQGAELISAQMQGANLSGAQLQGADVSDAMLRRAVLTATRLQDASFRGAQMQGADLSGARLQGTDFRGAAMAGVDLSRVEMSTETLFTYATLPGAAIREIGDSPIDTLLPFLPQMYAGPGLQEALGDAAPNGPGPGAVFNQAWRRWQNTLPDFPDEWKARLPD